MMVILGLCFVIHIVKNERTMNTKHCIVPLGLLLLHVFPVSVGCVCDLALLMASFGLVE